jgi:dihydrofolate reductase
MPKIRYRVTMSLDGYIAGPNGEIDWIVMDPEIDFASIFSEFDTLLVGRRTFDTMVQAKQTTMPGMQTIVFSRTLDPSKYPGVTVVSGNQHELLASLRQKPGKDKWLFGGGALFASLLDMGFVDTVEVAIIPVLLGAGVPLAPPLSKAKTLQLTAHKIFAKTGIVSLHYAVK